MPTHHCTNADPQLDKRTIIKTRKAEMSFIRCETSCKRLDNIKSKRIRKDKKNYNLNYKITDDRIKLENCVLRINEQ